MSDLSSLIARLEAAEGPDTEIDARVWAYFAKVKYVSHNEPYGDCHGRSQVVFTIPPKRTMMVTNSPAFPHAEPITSSIDAAVSLAERVLPPLSKIQPETYVGGKYHHCEIETEEGDFEADNCPNAALAICLATLRALEGQNG